ncbi:MAG: carbohydrate kinase family protein [Lentisphaerae bacterium]|nr:carbohydrate kinase family protein [Lentisphaerota bacterium]
MTTPGSAVRKGIVAAGNWIVDHVKIVDRLPGPGMLGNIRSETLGTGGCPFNVLVDLARLKAPFPLAGLGVIGNDEGRSFVENVCRQWPIDISRLAIHPSLATSYTDVMTQAPAPMAAQSGGGSDRVFYHCRGANAAFAPEHVPIPALTCRIFHLGYLLLLDRMDEPDGDHGTVAAGLLKQIQDAGIKTSVDVVSEESDRFHRVVPAALRYTNYLILNEIEAGRTVGRSVRTSAGALDGPALVDVVEALSGMGSMDLIAVHMPEGAYLRTRSGERLSRGSLRLPDDFIRGTVGAGDAFCAGMLLGLHENWAPEQCMRLGACAAAASLAHPSATDGMLPLEKALELGRRFPEREPPVKG